MSKLKIDTITAFVAIDKDGNEGIMGFKGAQGWIPMVGADKDRTLSLIPIANKIAVLSGVDYKIVQFTTRTDVTEEVLTKYMES